MKIERKWSMPNKNTFDIKLIKEFNEVNIMLELVEKLGYDVETTTKFISEHNQKILHYWTTSLETFLLLVAIIVGYIIYKKVADELMSGFLFMLLLGSCFLAYLIVPDQVFRPLLTEEKQIIQKEYKDVKNKDIDTSKYEVRISKDRKYLVLDNKGNNIKFTYYIQKGSDGIIQPNNVLQVVGETDKEFLVDVKSFITPESSKTEIIKLPKDVFKVTE